MFNFSEQAIYYGYMTLFISFVIVVVGSLLGIGMALYEEIFGW